MNRIEAAEKLANILRADDLGAVVWTKKAGEVRIYVTEGEGKREKDYGFILINEAVDLANVTKDKVKLLLTFKNTEALAIMQMTFASETAVANVSTSVVTGRQISPEEQEYRITGTCSLENNDY